ncbi:choice-of-anchor K domain-containing protein [Paludisphaera sp.]|uniref:choice-of-anchor K domain-containing protein n=1 Tax=Paludisphaera sp. TaxID=2017432 RepID=UPI00301C6CB2
MSSTLFRGLGLAAALSFLAFPSVGLADPIVDVVGTTSGTFGSSGLSTYSWNGQNQLTWASSNASPLGQVGTAFSLGTLTFYNANGNSSLGPVALNIGVTLTDPGSGTSAAYPWTVAVTGFVNNNNPENVELHFTPQDYEPITFGQYRLSLLGFGTSAPGVGATPGDFTLSVANRGGTGSARLWAIVTADGQPAAVPEPSSVVLAGVAGLAGLAFTSRRLRAAARA